MAAMTIFAIAAVVSYLVAALAGAVGPRLGLVDLPDGELKTHSRPIPPLGGIGVVAGFLGGAAAAGTLSTSTVLAVLLAAGLGLVDDRLDLSPKVRLVVESLIGVILVAGPLLGGTIGVVEAVIGAVATVVLINAVNLFDGLDGLVTSSAAAGLLGIIMFPTFTSDARLLVLVGAGALIGFLPHNWNPARLFLGDNGSYTVGTILTAVIVELGVSGTGPLDMMAGAACATVFLVDLGSTLLRRRRAGVPLFAGDRSHTYDRLHDVGWSVRRIAASSALMNAVAAVVVVVVAGRSIAAAAALAVVLVLAATAYASVVGDIRYDPAE